MTTSLLLAALLAAVQLDPGTGLWFPPYASRTQYLSRDPAHPLMADVQRAFKENPALGDEVCGAFLAAGELATMTAQGARRQADCSSGAANTHCIMHALSMRLDATMDTQQWNVARQTIEKMASIIVSSGGNPLPVRTALMDLAQREAGSRRPEAVQIMSYLKSDPQDGYVTSQLKRYGESVPPGAPQPWQSPAAAEVVDDCPPRG